MQNVTKEIIRESMLRAALIAQRPVNVNIKPGMMQEMRYLFGITDTGMGRLNPSTHMLEAPFASEPYEFANGKSYMTIVTAAGRFEEDWFVRKVLAATESIETGI